MKKFVIFVLLNSSSFASASSLILAKDIKSDISKILNKDLDLLSHFQFSNEDSPQILAVMGLSHFSNQSITEWLEERIHYIVSPQTTSAMNIKLKRSIYVEEKNIIYPNPDLIPYSKELKLMGNISPDEEEIISSSVQLNNIGSAVYLSGKKEKILYGIKIPNGYFKSAKKIIVDTPRVGIVQIGDGFISTLITANKKKVSAWPNSIFRLANLFHEARHSDGNGASLAFVHATCPQGHAYEGAEACDESLNGSYAIGAHMVAEMAKECRENCSVMDKETLLLVTYDYLNRILPSTSKRGKAAYWDQTPESF